MNSAKKAHVIVGASAAGMAAATAIREIDSLGTVTVLSAEREMPYFRPMVPFIISSQKSVSEVSLIDKGPYVQTGINVRTAATVARLDPRRGNVELESGESVPYDRLLIATGSAPYIPPEIEGFDTEGAYALRTLADAKAAEKRATWTRRAVMIGGGLVNLKAAFALLKRGISVALVVYSPEVLSQLMEPHDARLIRQVLESAGLEIITGRSVVTIDSGTSGVSSVLLDNGQELPCEMVMVGKGVRPNTDFLEDSGVALDQGVVVDACTETNLPNIFAAGDVAVTFNPITGERVMTGLWTNAVEMGRCAGRNMAGQTSRYTGTFGIMNATQTANLPFISMGIVHTQGDDFSVRSFKTATTLRKLVFSKEEDRLLGVVLIGDITNAGLYRLLIRERRDVAPIKSTLIENRLHYGHLLPKTWMGR